MAPIRVGIIGLSADPSAWATLAHVGPIKEPSPLAKDFQLTALATSNPESAKAAAKAHGLPEEKGYSNAEDIAKDPDVDLVVVSVKVPMHKQLMMPALHAGKDVFVEWPLGVNLAEAEEMTSLAKEKGVKTYVGLQARVQSAMLKAKEIVSSGVLGRITSSTVLGIDSQLLNFPEKARYVNDPNSGASILSIPCAHTLDVILHVLSSEFSSLTATCSTTYPSISYTSTNNNNNSLSAPEPRKTANDIALTGTLTPNNNNNNPNSKINTEGAALSFHYIVTAPSAPSLFQWIVLGEKGAFKMEGSSFAVQMAAPKLYVAMAKEEGEGKGGMGGGSRFYERDGGGKWEEVGVEKGVYDGFFGGVGAVYEGIAKGRGGNEGIADFSAAVIRHKMVEAIARSAAKGTRESYL